MMERCGISKPCGCKPNPVVNHARHFNPGSMAQKKLQSSAFEKPIACDVGVGVAGAGAPRGATNQRSHTHQFKLQKIRNMLVGDVAVVA